MVLTSSRVFTFGSISIKSLLQEKVKQLHKVRHWTVCQTHKSINVLSGKEPTSLYWRHTATISFFATVTFLPWILWRPFSLNSLSTFSRHWFHQKNKEHHFQLKEKISASSFIMCRSILLLFVYSLTKLNSGRLIEERLWSNAAHLIILTMSHWCSIAIGLVNNPQKCWMWSTLVMNCRDHKNIHEVYWVHLIWTSSLLAMLPTRLFLHTYTLFDFHNQSCNCNSW